MHMSNIRLIDICQRGGSFIIEKELKKGTYQGTLYYHPGNRDENLSAVDVIVRYHDMGGAEITGPVRKDTEYEKFKEYIQKISSEDNYKNTQKKRALLKIAFGALKVLVATLIIINATSAALTMEFTTWKRTIAEIIILTLTEYASKRSLRY